MFAKTVLDNGIRVVSHEMPEHRSVSLGIWVENGSRHESEAENGISHFIEHLLFKGTERRSAAQIAEEMDAVGGVLNAFTSKEHTCYYAKVLDENLPLAIDLLTDIFLHSSFDAEEIERERSVILQEISQAEDTPDDYVHDLFSLDFFKDHPIGRPICGREANRQWFQPARFSRFFQSRAIRPRRVIVAAAGNFRHERTGRRDRRAAWRCATDGAWRRSGIERERRVARRRWAAVFFRTPNRWSRRIFVSASPAFPKPIRKRYIAYVLNTLLGGGMSSRLFQEIREKRGKAYSVYSFSSSYKDVGYFGVYAGTSVESTEEVVELILKELKSSRRAKSEKKNLAGPKANWSAA